MLEYGSKSPIGTRQERLLSNIMSEIVRTTTQEKPLEIGTGTGSRLYPHSHRTAFEDPDASTQAPLPRSPPLEIYETYGTGLPGLTPAQTHSHSQAQMQQQQMMHQNIGAQTMWYPPPQNAMSFNSQSPQTQTSPNHYMR